MKSDQPIGLYRIAKAANLPLQNADYWVSKMVEEGIIVCDDSGEQKLYLLQPLFYDPTFAKKFDRILTGLYQLVKNKLMLPKDSNREAATFSTLVSILHVIHLEESE